MPLTNLESQEGLKQIVALRLPRGLLRDPRISRRVETYKPALGCSDSGIPS